MAARIPPYEEPFPPEVAEQLDLMMATRAVPPIALFRVMTRNRAMANAGWQLGRYGLSKEFSLSLREREILIDRTSARLGCEYEWGVHVNFFAERAELSAEQIASLTHGSAQDACWTDARERLVLEAVDELVDTHDVSDPLWERLASHFTEPELLDLLCMTGWYHAICFMARGLRVPLEADAPRFADVAP